MRSAYSANATHSATQENPTQATPRQATCIAMNGSTRSQSMRSSSLTFDGSQAVASNQRTTAATDGRSDPAAPETSSVISCSPSENCLSDHVCSVVGAG